MARGTKSIEQLKELANTPISSSNPLRVPVWLVDSKNNKIGPYISQREAANDLGLDPKTVSRGMNYGSTVICKKNTGNVYTKVGEQYKVIKVNRWDRENTREDIMRFKKKTFCKGITIFAIDSKGNKREFPSVMEASRKLKISRDIINAKLKNRQLYNGYIFRKK